MSVSITLLWIFMIFQMVIMFFLIRLVTDFLNRFRLESSSRYNNNINNE